jgi:hypothetical protein
MIISIKRFVFNLSFLILIASFFSCNKGPKMIQEASTLDSLSQMLIGVKEKLNVFDSAQIELRYNTTMEDLNFVEQNIKDSISREAAQAFSSYTGARKNLKSFAKKRAQLFEKHEITQKQLQTLSADLKKGA